MRASLQLQRLVLMVVLSAGCSYAASITSTLAVSATAETVFKYTITADNKPTSFTASGLPAGLTLNKKTGVISGVPSASVGGVYSIGISASRVDSGGTVKSKASAKLVLSINGGTGVPVIVGADKGPFTAKGVVGKNFSFGISATGALPISFLFQNMPPGLGMSSNANGLGVSSNGNVVTGVPGVSGLFPGTVTATNASGSATAAINFEIGLLSGAPLIVSALNVNAEAENTQIPPLVILGNTPLTIKLDPATLPRGVTFDDQTGDFSGVAFDAGVFNIPISVTNANGSDSKTLVVTVTPMPIGNAGGSVKFTDSLTQAVKGVVGNTGPVFKLLSSATEHIDATLNNVDLTKIDDKTPVSIDIGNYHFVSTLGQAPASGRGGVFLPDKRAVFVEEADVSTTGTPKLRKVESVAIKFDFKNQRVLVKVVRTVHDDAADLKSVRSEDFEARAVGISETIPVKIAFGKALTAFYADATVKANFKTVRKGANQQLFTVSKAVVKGAGVSGASR